MLVSMVVGFHGAISYTVIPKSTSSSTATVSSQGTENAPALIRLQYDT